MGEVIILEEWIKIKKLNEFQALQEKLQDTINLLDIEYEYYIFNWEYQAERIFINESRRSS